MKTILGILCMTGSLMFCWQSSLVSAGAILQSNDVREFVHQIYIHGVPYEEASKFGSDAVPVLLSMLEDPKEDPYWANIAITLAIIGDDRAVEPLRNFIQEGSGELSMPRFNAKTSAIMALGYLVNKSENRETLDYLIKSLDPKVWDERGVRWTSPIKMETDDRNVVMTSNAILGLGLSGQPQAAEALQALQQPGRTDEEKEFREKVAPVVEEALKAHAIIAEEGLIAYYRRGQEG